MNIYLACDHGGIELKEYIKSQDFSKNSNHPIEFIDLGTKDSTSVDYPDFAKRVCDKLIDEPEALGLLICGSGQGMAMSANKYKHIRAALCWNEELANLAKSHNNANVLCLGARVITPETALKIFNTFLTTPYEGGRHDTRLKKMKEITND